MCMYTYKGVRNIIFFNVVEKSHKVLNSRIVNSLPVRQRSMPYRQRISGS